MIALIRNSLNLALCALTLFGATTHAQLGPSALNVGGTLFAADGTPVTTSAVTFRLEVWDQANTCRLYYEDHANQDLAASKGGFSLILGGGTNAHNLIAGTTTFDAKIFVNDGQPAAFVGCASPPTLGPGQARNLHISYDLGSGLVAMSPDVPVVSSAYAMIADTLQGKSANQFLQVNATGSSALSQANAEYAFSGTNWPRLQALLDGSSTQYAPAVATGPIDEHNQRLINVANPVAAQDATTKTYVDSNLAGRALDVSAVAPMVGNGSAIIWDATAGKWVAGAVSSAPTGAAGGALTGTYPNPTLAANAVTAASVSSTGIGRNRLVMSDAVTGAGLGFATCAQNEILKYDVSSGWACATVGSLAPVTSVAGRTGAVTLNAGDIAGLGTASLRDYGTAAAQLVQLDGSARLPSVDGSQLSNVNAQRLQSRAVASTAPLANQVLGWNSATSAWEPTTPSNAGITALSGDVVANGPGAVTATIQPNAITAAKINSVGIGTNRLLITDASTGATVKYADVCAVGEILKWSASGWTCAADAGATGAVTAVGAGAGLLGGTITSTGTLSVDVGVTANKIVQLNGTAQLPAVDGSLLTLVNAVRLQSRAVANIAPSAGQVLGWNVTSTQWEPVTTANGSVTNVAGGVGLLGGPITANGTLSVDVGVTANKIVQLNGSAQLPAVDGSLLTFVNATKLQSRIVSSAAPTSGQVLGWNTTTSQWEPASAATGSVTNVAAGAGLLGGPITTNGTLTVDVGTTANKILQLNAGAQIPAVDGSLLTAVNAVTLQTRTVAATAPTAGQVLGWNVSATQWEPVSASSGSVTSIVATTGLLGGTITSSGTVSVDVGAAAGKIVQENGNAQIAQTLGTPALPSYAFAGDVATGLYSPGAGQMTFVNSGTASLAISANGAVAVGAAIPYAKLDVTAASNSGNGAIRANVSDGTAFTTGATLSLQNASTTASAHTALMMRNGNARSYLVQTAASTAQSSLGIYNDVAGTPTRALTVAGASVGIGTDTPQAGLDIATTGTINSAIIVPRDSTANRPTAAVNGMLRYNSTINAMEGFINGVWSTFSSGTSAGTVTNVATGTGLLGGPITSVGTLNVDVGSAANKIVQENANAQIAQTLGTVALPSYSFAGNLNTGLFSPAANQLSLATNGTSALTILGSGFVGINTTTPAQALDVVGSVRGSGLIVAGAASLTNVSGNMSINSTADLNFANIGATPLVTVKQNGLMGIGTIAPQAGLDVALTGTVASAIIVPRDSTANRPTTAVNGMLRYNTTSNAMEAFANGAWSALGAPAGGLTGSGTTGYIPKYSGASTLAPSLIFDDGTNVGIGTTSPAAKLTVNGDMTLSRVLPYGGSVSFPTYAFSPANNSTGMFAPGTDTLAFVTGGTERLRVTANGSLGLGTNAPQAGLDVALTGTAASAIIVPRDSTANRPTAAVNGMLRYNNSINVMEGFINGTWSALSTGTSAGTVTNVAGGTGLLGGPITSNGTLSVDVGSAAGQIVQENANAQIAQTLGTAALPAYSFAGNTNTGLYSPGAGQLNLSANGTAALTIAANGGVGIGTSNPASLLEVTRNQNATSGMAVYNQSTAAGASGALFVVSDASSLGVYSYSSTYATNFGGLATAGRTFLRTTGASSTGLVLDTAPATPLILATNDVDRIHVNGNGFVGINSTTPAAGLDVNFTGTAASAIIVPRDSTANRPTAAVNGMLRYNNTLNAMEGFINGAWATLSAGSSAGTVTNIATSTGLLGGPISSTGTLSVDVGTAANQIVQENASGQIAQSAGTAAAPAYAFVGNLNSGLFSPAAGQLSLASNGTSALSILASGNVGIGTTTPSFNLSLGGATSARTIGLEQNPSGAGNGLTISAGAATGTSLSGGPLVLSAGASTGFGGSSIVFKAANPAQPGGTTAYAPSTVMTLTGQAYLGVGQSNPGYGIDVNNSGPLARFTNNITPAAGVESQINMAALNSGYSNTTYGRILSGTSSVTAGAENGYLTLSTIRAGALTEGVRLSAAGNVGIGTNAPQAGLDVALTGTIASAIIVPRDSTANRPTAAVNGMLRYNNTLNVMEGFINGAWSTLSAGAGAGTVTNIATSTGLLGGPITSNGTLSVDVGSAAGKIVQENTNAQIAQLAGTVAAPSYSFSGNAKTGLYSPAINQLALVTNGTAAMNVTAAGYLGIGTTSPASKLDMYQNNNLDMVVSATNLSSGKATYMGILANSGFVSYNLTGVNVAWSMGENGSDSFSLGDGTNNTSPLIVEPGAKTNTLYLASTGRLGIGTSAPLAGLDVSLTGTGNSAIIVPRDSTANRPSAPVNGMIRYNTATSKFEAFENNAWANVIGGGGSPSFPLLANPIGSAGAPAYSFSGNANTGVYSPGTNQVAIATNGTAAVSILANGYVGIGTSSPVAPLVVNGAIRTLGGTGELQLVSRDGAGSMFSWYVPAGGTSMRAYVNSLGDALAITQVGTVGIGTIAPQAGLDVALTGTAASAIIVPRDSTANRPSAPVNGMIRYNSTLSAFEGYAAGAWSALGGGGGGSSLTCPGQFLPYPGPGTPFCIKPTSQDNASGQPINPVASLTNLCANVGASVCSFQQLFLANRAGLIALNSNSSGGGTYNGQGAFTIETVFSPQAYNYDQNAQCPQISSTGGFTTASCSQSRSFFCCL